LFVLYKNDPYDPPRRVVSFDDLDNKAFWCNLGEDKEKAFINVMKKIDTGYSVDIHPEKETNPYHPDLEIIKNNQKFLGEAKIKNSPLFIAERYGVDPQFALTMDLKDSFNYIKWLEKGVDILIFLWIRWEAHEMILQNKSYKVKPMRGIWVTEFSKLRKKELSDNKPGIHWYYDRYRRPPVYNTERIENKELLNWCNELKNFESRLIQEDGRIKNITSDGYFEREGRTYPTGHSSASYVFDLNDEDIFQNIFIKY